MVNSVQGLLQQLLLPLNLGSGWRLTPVSGGCIAQSFRLDLPSGHQRLFVKHLATAPQAMFKTEAAGLDALRQSGQINTPQVILQSEQLLVLEWLEPCQGTKQLFATLGRQLASMHRHSEAEQFGFEEDNYCGLTPQPNQLMSDGYQFFAEQRLLFQGKRAYQAGLLEQRHLQQLERLCARLDQLIPKQAAVLIHGDLWPGNIFFSQPASAHKPLPHQPDGAPYLIDPAAHYGWAEAELAMTRLFGGFPDAFYQAYQEVNPLLAGWRQRQALYNLYHLLNHLNLFGSSYLQQVVSTITHYN